MLNGKPKKAPAPDSSPRVLDLFAGCGGMSLGFHAVGFRIAGAVEFDPLAAQSHALNFCRDSKPAEFKRHAASRDITQTDPDQLAEELDLAPGELEVIIGGPPCQSYARVGRAKLREVYEHPHAFKLDPRANLYLRYLEYVRYFRPRALVMENVPDVLNNGGHNIAEEMAEALEAMGYICRYTLLNAAFYGVPQMRERAFLIGYAADLGAELRFPEPTHWTQLPVGYQGSRDVALKAMRNRKEPDLYSEAGDSPFRYVEPALASPQLPPAVTAEEAIGDLPPITLHLEGKLRRGARRFENFVPYSEFGKPSPYARRMRDWPGFTSPNGVADHVIRTLPRDYALFRRMNPGDQYPQAYAHALDMFAEAVRRAKRRGETVKEGTAGYERLWKSIVPPYDHRKFPNKWRKMERDMPSRTLMAHIGKDTYSHIHYDSEQARTISVREAARLQSFPDGFIFAGTMNPAFRQIGNAVPPLMAAAIARVVRVALLGETSLCREESHSRG
jgi:DNA (cytosine-5)-methyltransferase 1